MLLGKKVDGVQDVKFYEKKKYQIVKVDQFATLHDLVSKFQVCVDRSRSSVGKFQKVQ